MARKPEIGNVQVYPLRPLRKSDKNGYVLKFYCPIRGQRIRKNCGTRDPREARRVMRECRQRLQNGKYVESGGAITIAHRQGVGRPKVEQVVSPEVASNTWERCSDEYYRHRKQRGREKSLADASSRIGIVDRILKGYREDRGHSGDGTLDECVSLKTLEYAQDRLLAGDECRYDARAPMTVNTTMGAIMAFLNYCAKHGWLKEVPLLSKLDVDEVMKGRPITSDEFEHLMDAVGEVTGSEQAESWKQVLHVLWESAFRIGDAMNFSWDDERRIHPNWPSRNGHFPTLIIPSTQKNKKAQEIPMLPGLRDLLESVPKENRTGWVVNPAPMEFEIRAKGEWFRPTSDDLVALAGQYNNSAIARACGITETTVRKWLQEMDFQRAEEFDRHHGEVSPGTVAQVRKRAERLATHSARRSTKRLSKERVGRIIGMIGEQAQIVVQQPNEESGRRIKYASAHDLRRGCAQRLINAGISAETLKTVLRHKNFKTTEQFYGATRAAQSAAAEIDEKLS